MTSDGSLLCFFPEADLLNWYSIELATAQAAQEFFPRVEILGCSGNLRPLCAAMLPRSLDMASSRREREQACRSCRGAKAAAKRQLDLTWVEMSVFETNQDQHVANEVCKSVTFSNYLDVEFDGIPVGRYATYIPHLSSKGAKLTQVPLLWDHYLAELASVVKVILMSNRAFDSLSPAAVLTSNHAYGTHRAFLTVARKRGIQAWGMASGALLPGRANSLVVFPEELSSQTVSLSRAANESVKSPLTDFELSLIEGHMRALRGGTDPWVYSSASSGKSPAQLRNLLGIRSSSPVVTVLLASPDEMESAIVANIEFRVGEYAGNVNPQEFLEAVLDCARQLPDVDFVVRIHPRMIANKRESVTSPGLVPLLERLASTPDNLRVCHPDMKVSLYDNILISDSAINYTSTSGLEFMSLGLPVVHVDDMRLGVYPASLGVSAAGVADLPRAVLTALEAGWRLENAERALRWWATAYIRAALFPFLPDHVVASEAGSEGSPAEKAPSWARLVPTFIKERLAGAHLWVEQRRFTFPRPNAVMAQDLQQALQTRPQGVIWEPTLFPRGRPLADEGARVLQVLASAARDLGWLSAYGPGAPGIGQVKQLLRAID